MPALRRGAPGERPGGGSPGGRRPRGPPGPGRLVPEEARRILGPEAILGLSTHSREEVLAARGLPLDYINIGPMSPTATKEHARYGTLGPDLVVELAEPQTLSPSPPWGKHQEAPPAGPVPEGTSDRGHGDRESAWPRIPAVRVRELLAESAGGRGRPAAGRGRASPRLFAGVHDHLHRCSAALPGEPRRIDPGRRGGAP